jgi:NADPH:quinone reductase
MRALELQSLTGPDGLVVASRPAPKGADHIVIRAHAAGVCYPDLLISQGRYQDKPSLPLIPGREIAGTVISAPPGSHVRPGDRVWALLDHGGFAEVCAARPDHVFPLPNGISFIEGAALPVNFLTAVFALQLRARLLAGEHVLVLGAGGGLGSGIVGVAATMGARVLGVVSTASKRAVAVAAGADDVVIGPNWPAEVQNRTGGRGVDLVADVVGGDQTLQAIRITAAQGRVVLLGFPAGIAEVRTNRLLLRNVGLLGAGLGPFLQAEPDALPALGTAVGKLVKSGLRPVIGGTYQLHDGADALRQLEARTALGKLVLNLDAIPSAHESSVRG